MQGQRGVIANPYSKSVSTADIQLQSVRVSRQEVAIGDVQEYEEQFSYKRFPFRWMRLQRGVRRKRELLFSVGVPGIASMPVSPSTQSPSLSPLRSPHAIPRRGGGFLFNHQDGLRKKPKPLRLPHLPRVYLN